MLSANWRMSSVNMEEPGVQSAASAREASDATKTTIVEEEKCMLMMVVEKFQDR